MKVGVRIDLDELEIIRTNESSGDEPYLWLFLVKVDGSTLSLTDLEQARVEVVSPKGAHGNVTRREDLPRGTLPIPDVLGRLETDLVPIAGIPLEMSDRFCMAAVGVVALEEDATSDAAAVEGWRAARKELEKQLTAILRQAIRQFFESNDAGDLSALLTLTQSAVDAVIGAVESAMKDGTIGPLLFLPIVNLAHIGAVVDPDEPVGRNLAGPFTAERIRAMERWSSFPIGFRVGTAATGEGVYELRGHVRRTDVPPLYAGLFGPAPRPQPLISDRDYDEFAATWAALHKSGFDLVRLATFTDHGVRQYAGVFRLGHGGQHLVDMDARAFVDFWLERLADTPPTDMLDFDTYVDGDVRRYVGVFSPGQGGQHFVPARSFQGFVDFWKERSRDTPPRDLKAVTMYEEGGRMLFTGLFGPGNGGQHFLGNATFDEVMALWTSLADDDPPIDLTDISLVDGPGGLRCAAVFTPGRGGQRMYSGLDFATLKERRNELLEHDIDIFGIDVF